MPDPVKAVIPLPDDIPGTWMRHMRRGDFEAAWQVSDAVLASRHPRDTWHLPRHHQSIWDGTPPDGKRVLVRCYHGLGDTIQFIRFAPLLQSIAKEVIVWAQPPLLPLLETAAGIDRLLPLHDGTPDADYEVDLEVMELPYLFRAAPATIPGNIPYLQVPPRLLLPPGADLTVGLAWKVSQWEEQRSIPFPLLRPLANIPGVRLLILQERAPERGWEPGAGRYFGDFPLEEYARVIRGLDAVITVDSMPAHLAGALGVPVWTLLLHDADWRWMEGRNDSPWYPTMRLFRQETPGDWAGVIHRVVQALTEWRAL